MQTTLEGMLEQLLAVLQENNEKEENIKPNTDKLNTITSQQ